MATVTLDSVTIHGLSRLGSKDKTQKYCWCFITILSLAIAGYFVGECVAMYLSHDIVLSRNVETMKPMKFPTVVFCNAVQLNDWLNDWPEQVNFTTGFDQIRNFEFFCMFNQKKCNLTRSKLFPPSCLVFNEAGKHYQHIPLHREGLILHLYLNTSDFPTLDALFLKGNVEQAGGITVSVVPPNTYTKPINSKLRVIPGTNTVIGLRAESIVRLPDPFPSKCTDLETLNSRTRMIPGNYSIENCFVDCMTRALYDECDYIQPELRGVLKLNSKINNLKNVTCLQKTWRYYSSGKGRDLCNCPLPCKEDIFEIKSHSSTPWPDYAVNKESYIAGLDEVFPNENVTIEFVKKHIVRVEMSFNNFEKVTIKEKEKYSFLELFSDYGGLIGVYTGASFISWFELVIYLYCRFVKKRKQKDAQIDEEKEIQHGCNDATLKERYLLA